MDPAPVETSLRRFRQPLHVPPIRYRHHRHVVLSAVVWPHTLQITPDIAGRVNPPSVSSERPGSRPGCDDRGRQSREQGYAGHEIGARVPSAGSRRVLGIGRVVRHAHAFPGDEQAVRVQKDRRARHQCDQIAAGSDAHAPQIVRVDLADARDLVGKGLSGVHVEHVAFPQFGEPGEQGLVRHSRVSGDDAVRALAADGQARAVQMAEPVVQRVRVGPMAHGQVHADRRDLDRRMIPSPKSSRCWYSLSSLNPKSPSMTPSSVEVSPMTCGVAASFLLYAWACSTMRAYFPADRSPRRPMRRFARPCGTRRPVPRRSTRTCPRPPGRIRS